MLQKLHLSEQVLKTEQYIQQIIVCNFFNYLK